MFSNEIGLIYLDLFSWGNNPNRLIALNSPATKLQPLMMQVTGAIAEWYYIKMYITG